LGEDAWQVQRAKALQKVVNLGFDDRNDDHEHIPGEYHYDFFPIQNVACE
jgi:hypothetical protein